MLGLRCQNMKFEIQVQIGIIYQRMFSSFKNHFQTTKSQECYEL